MLDAITHTQLQPVVDKAIQPWASVVMGHMAAGRSSKEALELGGEMP